MYEETTAAKHGGNSRIFVACCQYARHLRAWSEADGRFATQAAFVHKRAAAYWLKRIDVLTAEIVADAQAMLAYMAGED